MFILAESGRAQSLTAFDFLHLEPSTHSAALGGTAVTLTESDVSAFLYNPALINKGVDRMLAVTYLKHLSDLHAGFAAYSRDLGRWGTAAAGLRFLHWGSIMRADEQGNEHGTFSSNDIALTVGLANEWREGIRYGVNLHAIYADVAEYNAMALAADVGVVWYIPKQLLTLAGSLNNLGVVVSSLGTTRDQLPVDLRVSVSKRLRYIPLLAALTLHRLQDITHIESVDDAFRHAIFSLEFEVTSIFQIRLGYSHNRRNLQSDSRLDLAGIGVGFGLKIRKIRIDYAFNSWSFAGLHQFTLGTKL